MNPNLKISVVQLINHHKYIDPNSPYVNPTEQVAKGSGFFIDIDRGLILTNSHVIENSVDLYALIEKLGTRKIELKIISLCVEKDIALCQIIKTKDIEDIKPVYLEGLSFHYIKEMIEVIDLALIKNKVKNPVVFE